MPFILGATVLSEVRLATMQRGEGLKEKGMHHINLCSLEGQLYRKSKSSEKVTGVSENSLDFLVFHYLLPPLVPVLSWFCCAFNINTQLIWSV